MASRQSWRSVPNRRGWFDFRPFSNFGEFRVSEFRNFGMSSNNSNSTTERVFSTIEPPMRTTQLHYSLQGVNKRVVSVKQGGRGAAQNKSSSNNNNKSSNNNNY
eukprot:scaffold1116_cov180-Ochromonas_danica.AAC.6